MCVCVGECWGEVRSGWRGCEEGGWARRERKRDGVEPGCRGVWHLSLVGRGTWRWQPRRGRILGSLAAAQMP